MGCISRLKQCRIRRGLLGGVLVLIIVDVIWVASAALTKVSLRRDGRVLYTIHGPPCHVYIYIAPLPYPFPWGSCTVYPPPPP